MCVCLYSVNELQYLCVAVYLIYRDSKNVPSVHNAMIVYDDNDDEPFKLRNDTSHDISVVVTPYTVVDIGDIKGSNSTFQPSHLPNDKIEPPKPSNADDRSAPQNVSYVV